MASNKGRVLPPTTATVLDNPVKMYLIKKTNEYNQRLNEAANSTDPNTFMILGTEPNNRSRVYVGKMNDNGKGIWITDLKTQKQWLFPTTYEYRGGGHLAYFDNMDTISKINDRYKSKGGNLGRIRSKLFNKIYNGEGLTLGELTDRDILNVNNNQ